MNIVIYVCCCVFGVVATVSALIYSCLPSRNAKCFDKKKRRETKYMIEEKEELNHQGERLKLTNFSLDLKCIRQSRRQHKGEIYFLQPDN